MQPLWLCLELVRARERVSDLNDYLSLVRRLGTGGINRSENDLSSNLKDALASFGLHGVIDTGSGSNRAKRPDIALYADPAAADVGAAADVVVEAKKPAELDGFAHLKDALVDDGLWHDKLVPYVAAHADRVTYFVLTTFERFLVLPVDPNLRRQVLEEDAYPDEASRRIALSGTLEFDLRAAHGEQEWTDWCRETLTPATLAPPPCSEITDIREIGNADELEHFASALADVVVGPEGRATPGGALISAIRLAANGVEELPEAAHRALVIYTMAAHGGMSVEAADAHLARRWREELAEFIAASVHSLIGRLFSVKVIEDSFCIDTDPPLIPETDWVFHSDRFDGIDQAELPERFFSALAGLSQVANPAVRDLAATGRFYDWLAPQVSAPAFRRLLALFFSHNFIRLDDDLLGRFFEIYAQRVDRRRRRQLGQYYTPLPIVRHMWAVSMEIARERGVSREIIALDPGAGSGTFLIEGANRLHDEGIERFWERLTGFDISPQAIGIAQTNLYLAVLARLDRTEAEEVGTLQLYPTDALDPRNGARLRSILPLLADESTRSFIQHRIELSETVKRQSRFPLVIGNPPYRNNSNQTLAQVAERFPMLLRSSRDNARARKRNIRDDYAWFFAAADHYVADQGLIAFVVSDSFCYASSYRFFREDLLRRYRVRSLVNLGASVFRDVGPRTQFVIVVLERRAEDLGRADDCEPIPYIDLRPLAIDPATFATATDPRLLALDARTLPASIPHLPTRARSFTLYPAADVVSLVERFPNVLHGDSSRRVFLKKWPGVITAFDELFRGDSREILDARLRRFFEIVRIADEDARERALDEFAIAIRATSEKNRGRLSLMAAQAAAAGLSFSPERLRRIVTGSAPNDVAWYPDERLTSWLYYEPGLRVPRNVHEGRDPGYGTMSQWRDDESHAIDPKLVFTTGTNPEYGLKALIVSGDWMVKSHGGESQQFHYTGLENPLRPPNLAGPNNLGDDAQLFIAALAQGGRTANDFLLYIAGIYNSQLAEDYLAGGGANVMRIPLSTGLVTDELAGAVIDLARELHHLHWLVGEGEAGVDADAAEAVYSREELERFGFEEHGGTGGRFRQRRTWCSADGTSQLVEERVMELRGELDNAVEFLFRV